MGVDVTQQIQLHIGKLATNSQDLLRTNQNLEQFTHIALHDLQKPLRKIQQYAGLRQERYIDYLREELRAVSSNL